MERLTIRNSVGVAVYKHPYECERCGEPIYRLPDFGSGSPTDKLAEYEEIGTAEELTKLKEKEIAKPIIKNANGVFCPKCWCWINHRQYTINVGEDHPNRCEWCGQRLNWGKENED